MISDDVKLSLFHLSLRLTCEKNPFDTCFASVRGGIQFLASTSLVELTQD